MLEALSGQEAPAVVTEAVHAETDGNPFFMEEVYRHLVEEGRLLDDEGRFRADLAIGELDVPENVRLVLDRRLNRLSAEARRLLAAAAALGRFFSFELVEALADLGPDELLDTMDECERARLVLPASSDPAHATRYLFTHELVRQTILAGLSTPRRCRLHLRVAEAIERLAGSVADDQAADLAHHLAEAGPGADQTKLLHYLVIAGRRAMAASAFEEGARHLEGALALGLATGRQQAELLEEAGRAYRAVGRLDEALALWDHSIATYEALQDAESVGRVCQEAAVHLAWGTHWEQALAMIDRGLRALKGGPSTGRCHLLAFHALLLGGGLGQLRPAQSELDEALAAAEHLHDEGALGYAFSSRTCVEFCYLSHPAAADAGRRGSERLRAAGDLSQAAMTLGWTVVSLVAAGRWPEAARVEAELAPLAERLAHYPALLMTGRATAMREFFTHGDIDRLVAFARGDLELNRRSGLGWAGMAITWLGLGEFLRGRWPEALALFRDAAAEDPPGPLDGTCTAFLFEQLAYLGAAGEALELLDTWKGRLPRAGEPAPWGAWQMLFSAVEGLVVLGQRERAASYYPPLLDALATGTVAGNYHDGRLIERVAGIAAAAGADWSSAERHYSTALAQAGELPHVLEQLHTRLWYGRMLLDRRGPRDEDRAAQLLAEAAEGYRRFGLVRHQALSRAARTSSGIGTDSALPGFTDT
jgi:tetratricopeptide (TPR) repeat protein